MRIYIAAYPRPDIGSIGASGVVGDRSLVHLWKPMHSRLSAIVDMHIIPTQLDYVYRGSFPLFLPLFSTCSQCKRGDQTALALKVTADNSINVMTPEVHEPI